MGRIDAHVHFWKFNKVKDAWINDEMKMIQRDFLPYHLQPLLSQHNYDGCVVVQSDQSYEENIFQIQNAEKFDFIKGIVGWVDLISENVDERLNYYSQIKLVKGFRHILQGEKERNFMLRPNFINGIRLLEKYNFTFDILIFPDQLKYIPDLVSLFPNQLFVIDHIAKPNIRNKDIYDWKIGIEKIAMYENVSCKLSGLITEANWNNWEKDDFNPYLDVIVENFGIHRIMFGSDWPVCLVAGLYADVVGIIEDYFSALSKNEQEQIFTINATRFYQL